MITKYFGSILFLIAIVFVFAIAGEMLFLNLPQAQAQCTAGAPGNLSIRRGPTQGSAILSWTPAANANRYALVFGTAFNNYTFGSLNIDGGVNTNYMVTHLSPGTRYFFRVWAFCDSSGPATASSEVTIAMPAKLITKFDPPK